MNRGSLLGSALPAVMLFCTFMTNTAAALGPAGMWMARMSGLKGDQSCRPGDVGCNQCASNVPAAFAAFKNAGGKDFEYEFEVAKSYSPAGLSPAQFFTILPTDGGGHLQSLVRIPLEGSASDRTWFAATYGSGSIGASVIYLISAPTYPGGTLFDDGKLQYVFRAPGEHPGGSQAVGKHLIVSHDEVADKNGYMEVYDFGNIGSETHVRLPTLGDSRIAASAGAKLAGGGLLVLGKRAGDGNREYQLYYADRVADGAPGWQFVNTATGLEQVENISLVTECGSGTLYVVTATGDSVPDNNYWKLYRLTQERTGPTLTLVDSVTKNADSDCDARASGTAYVARGALRFYCAQKVATETRMGVSDCILPWLFPGVGLEVGCVKTLIMDQSMTLREY